MTGGIDSVALFHKGWSIRESLGKFQRVAEDVFVPRPARGIQVLPNIHNALMSCFSDTLYSAEAIDESLQREFGTETSLDDCSSFASRHGIKLGLAAATVEEHLGRLLLTNYNGFGRRVEGCGRSKTSYLGCNFVVDLHPVRSDCPKVALNHEPCPNTRWKKIKETEVGPALRRCMHQDDAVYMQDIQYLGTSHYARLPL